MDMLFSSQEVNFMGSDMIFADDLKTDEQAS
jgi:hypothetical protein